ncbi:MAG: invasion associated locus B family protein [Acidocella sp.]|nr:invasion associated locus B family protein [Acidocella sp.]
MNFLRNSVFVSCILASLAPLSALAADQPNAPTPPAAPPAAPPAQPVAVAPKLFAQVYGDWVYRCLSNAAEGQPATMVCSVQQQLVLKKDGHVTQLLTVTFVKGDTKGHDVNILAPLGVALKPGVELSVNTSKPVAAAYSFCNENGCFVINQPAAHFTKDIHSNQAKGHAKIGLMNGKLITIDFSLKGLVPALAALDSGVPPAREVKPG